jgi:crotonobetainyl-CoA:carnitine CoA-transferase CaiB-like acyl-CoA transferase
MSVVSRGPLSGVRVLDVTRFLAGPYASMLLAELGAEVIKLEDPNRPDEARTVGPFFQNDFSLYFAALNAGKKAAAISLSSPDGRELAQALAASCDVVLDNNKPGVMAKLGLDSASLRRKNERLVTCSISGYGDTGPSRLRAGYDYTIQAHAGVMSLTGEPEGPPGKAGISYVDHSAGITAAFAICAALVERANTGRGRHVDLALFDLQISMLSYLASWHLNADYEGERTANAGHPSLVPAQNFRTSDGYITVFVGNDEMWARMTAALNDEVLSDNRFRTAEGRRRGKKELVARLGAMLASSTTCDVLELLEGVGVPAAPVNSLETALADPQVGARKMVVPAEHPVYGGHRRVAGPLVDMRIERLPAAPLMGEHTQEVLRSVGVPAERLCALSQDGTIYQRTQCKVVS